MFIFISKEACEAFSGFLAWLWSKVDRRQRHDPAEEARLLAATRYLERQEWIKGYEYLCRQRGEKLAELYAKQAAYHLNWSGRGFAVRKLSWLCRKDGREIRNLRYLLKNHQFRIDDHLNQLEVKVLRPPTPKR